MEINGKAVFIAFSKDELDRLKKRKVFNQTQEPAFA
jgi:hypothetical protein